MSPPLIIKLIAQQVQVRETVPKAYDLNVPQLQRPRTGRNRAPGRQHVLAAVDLGGALWVRLPIDAASFGK